MSQAPHPESVELRQESGYRFEVSFGGGIPPLMVDEPAPLGAGSGPSPVQLLAAAVGNCLSASLHFAVSKFGQATGTLRTVVEPDVGRNAENRLRVRAMRVRITLGVAAASIEHLDRALDRFEDFCTVTASVRQGIEVVVEVYDGEGRRLK